jgi:hypothetical protein
VGRTPPDAGHLPVSHASSLRSFPSSCHVLEGISGTRDHAACRPENSGHSSLSLRVSGTGLKYLFRLTWMCGCMYPRFLIYIATYGRTYWLHKETARLRLKWSGELVQMFAIIEVILILPVSLVWCQIPARDIAGCPSLFIRHIFSLLHICI